MLENNHTLDLSTDMKTKMLNSDALTTYKCNYDSINYKHNGEFQIEEMHITSVRYLNQIKKIEERQYLLKLEDKF